MKNDQIPKFWRNNTPAKSHTNSLTTDGYSLYSYNLLIGLTSETGEKILYNYTSKANSFVSSTTSQHVNLATFYADRLVDAPQSTPPFASSNGG